MLTFIRPGRFGHDRRRRSAQITDPEMTRYFMTVREAVEVVLQASALGVDAPSAEAGKIYVLDMGEPVRIMDLARQVIRLAGLRTDKDIEIVVTGIRPGEKLREERFHQAEPLVATGHPGLSERPCARRDHGSRASTTATS